MNELEPKPPELIQKLEWLRLHGLRHWKIVGCAFLVVVGVAGWNFVTSKVGAKGKNPPASSNKAGEKEFSAPLIHFSDGSSGTVELGYEVKVNTDLIVEAFKTYGSEKAALSSLQASVYGTAISVLEAKSQEYVRKNRVKVSAEIIDRTKEAQTRTGYQIVELSIGEIK